MVKLTDANNNVLSNFVILDRGYTGHEHLLGVGLVHMNGRLYDPKLHRFLMPDNYVQDPYNTQNFNRYGYVLNNPLKYTDASGEFFWFAFGIGAIIGAVTGAAGYIAHAIVSGNWSWGQFSLSVIGGALIGGLSGGIAPSSAMTGSAAEALLYGAGAFTAGLMPSLDFNVGNWGFSVSPSIAFGTGKGPIGIGVSGGYRDKNFGFSVSGTARKGGFTAGGGVSFSNNGQTFSFGGTYYGGKDSQSIWYTAYSKGDFSFAMTNDAWLSGDKYRTAAAEVGVGDYSFGLNLYTTEPPTEEYEDRTKIKDFDYESPIWKKNKYGTYSSGERIFAGAYVGVRRGNSVQRLGVDAPFVQDFFQNGIHRHIVKGPYFNTNFGSGPSIFIQNFTHNPWTLYSK